MRFQIINLLIAELSDWISHFLRWLPGAIGYKLRYYYYHNLFKNCGKKVHIDIGCYLKGCQNIILGNNIGFGLNSQVYASGNGSEKISIGDNTFFNANVMINADCGGVIEIGSHCIVGPNVIFRTSNHVFTDRNIPIMEQGHNPGKIIIKDDVWIGANVVLLPNISVGKGAIIGAGAVVTKNIDDYAIVAGVPAKQIGSRNKPIPS